MDQNDILELLDSLTTMVTEAWGVPLGNDKCIIEREKALQIINDIKAALPSSVAEAKRLVAARDEFIGNAKREAEAMRKSAEEHARILVDDQEVVRQARAKSAEMVAKAEAKTAELKRVANVYIEQKLKAAEDAINNSLAEIRNAHQRYINTASNPVAKPKPEPTFTIPELGEDDDGEEIL